mmetsp:Transcript_2534/g.7528  ORF Transcript_2534/g.7528 Transcript_2534/m.7528 type:complete len:224 (-) Transcript_2534:67-738(-)
MFGHCGWVHVHRDHGQQPRLHRQRAHQLPVPRRHLRGRRQALPDLGRHRVPALRSRGLRGRHELCPGRVFGHHRVGSEHDQRLRRRRRGRRIQGLRRGRLRLAARSAGRPRPQVRAQAPWLAAGLLHCGRLLCVLVPDASARLRLLHGGALQLRLGRAGGGPGGPHPRRQRRQHRPNPRRRQRSASRSWVLRCGCSGWLAAPRACTDLHRLLTNVVDRRCQHL